jgi:transposase
MEIKMSGTPKRQFTHEYRAEAVKLVTEQGMQLTAAARKLSLSVQTYANWVSKARAGKLARIDAHRLQPVNDLNAEVSRLKRELAIACEERDILKKATAYFAKLSK